MGQASGGITKDSERFCPCMIGEINNHNRDFKWIFCEGCQTWFHTYCVLLTDFEYEYIKSNGEKWFCDSYTCQEKRINGLKQVQHQQNEIFNLTIVEELPQSNGKSSQDEIKCSKCNFIAKNSRGLKVHKRKHKENELHVIDLKGNSEKVESLVQDDKSVTDASNISNPCEISSQSKASSENSNDLVPCLLCKDNKKYKKNGGLKIHCRRKHKNEDYSIMFEKSSTGEKFDVNSLSDKIGYYKRNIRILKRIPKGARMLAAYELAKVIEKTVENNDLSSWEELLFFVYRAFQVPENNKKNLTKVVKNNINNNNSIPTFKKFSKKQASLSKRVESKVAEGDLRGAVKLLSSSDSLAMENEETYLKLVEKHPSPSRIMNFPEIPADLPYLIVDEKKVSDGIFSFPHGSASGIDGLSPQHLKDLISKSTGEAGEKLLIAITKLSNLMLSGKVNEEILTIIYGANLCALTKNENDVRPIAVGCCYRRLTSKLACRSEFTRAKDYLFPKQVGVATKGGCEAAIHSVRSYISHKNGSQKVMVKVDLKNAFNSLERDDLLKGILKTSPNIYRFMHQCYCTPTTLFFGDYRISSEVGVQQGDPSGPLIFSEAIHPIIESLKSELNIRFLDDGTLIGDMETVKNDLKVIEEKFKEMGLEMNINKCELFVIDENSSEEKEFFKENFPGMKIVSNLSLLGSPITLNAVESVFNKKIDSLELLFSRLDILNKHVAYFLLKHCFGIPKLTFLLRTTPMWKFPEIVNRIDQSMKSTIERICNTRLDDYQYLISSLPCRLGGLGIRKVQDIMLPSFLSSICSTSSLINLILSGNTTDLVEVAHYSEGLDAWKLTNEPLQDNAMNIQRNWDNVNLSRIISSLQFPSEKHIARFKASSTPEASLWLSTLPSKNIGTLLDDNTFRISVALRLGSEMCHQYTCICGETVDNYGIHGLSCKKSKGKYARHREFNSIIARGMASANIPASLEPVGLFRDDGKRPDGITLTHWDKGSCLAWDATIIDTLANSYIHLTKNKAGSAAELASTKKHNLYKELKERNYLLLPFAVETLGPWSKEAISFTDTLGNLLNSATGEVRSKDFLRKILVWHSNVVMQPVLWGRILLIKNLMKFFIYFNVKHENFVKE